LKDVRARCSPNVHINVGRVPRIQAFYEAAHFSVAPFRTLGKPCPNSVIEALAVGRPALVSHYVDMGQVLEKDRAGVRFAPEIDALQLAYRTLCANYVELQANSRRCAETHFSLEAVIRHYTRVYDAVVSAHGRRA